MFKEGFITLDRKIVNWEWYKDTNTKVVFLHLLLIANWKDGRFKGYEVPRGSVITSISHLAKDVRLSFQQTRTALEHLQMTGEITIKTTNKFTAITIEKYDFYQDPTSRNNKQANKQTIINQQSNNNQTTTSENENFSVELVEKWANEFDDAEGKINPAGYVAYVESKDGNKNKVAFDSYCINILHLQKIKDKKKEEKAKTPEQIRQEEIDRWLAE